MIGVHAQKLIGITNLNMQAAIYSPACFLYMLQLVCTITYIIYENGLPVSHAHSQKPKTTFYIGKKGSAWYISNNKFLFRVPPMKFVHNNDNFYMKYCKTAPCHWYHHQWICMNNQTERFHQQKNKKCMVRIIIWLCEVMVLCTYQ